MGQVRNSVFFDMFVLPLLDNVQLADHQVMADAAELVTHNAVLTGAVRFDGDDHVVSRVDLHVDIDGLQREAVLHVDRRQMQPIGLIFFQLEYRPPVEQPAGQVHVAACRWMHDRETVFFPDRMSLDHRLRLRGKNLGFENGRYLKFGSHNEDNQAGAGINSDAGWQGKIEAEELPLAQLFVTILQRLGVETDFFAGHTGTLDRV